MPVQGQPRSVYCASTFLSTTPQWPGPQCELLKVAVIMVIMMMMTVMVMSISRLDSGRSPGTGSKRQRCAVPDTHHSFDIMSHWELILSPSFLFSYVLTASCHSALENHSLLTASLTLPPSITLTLSLLSFSLYSPPSAPSLCIWAFCLSSVYLSTLLHLYPSPLSHSFPVILVLLTHGVIAQSRASIFMTISAYASRFLLACVIVAELGRGRQIRPWGVEKITSRL